jgi:hypothetical protein
MKAHWREEAGEISPQQLALLRLVAMQQQQGGGG